MKSTPTEKELLAPPIVAAARIYRRRRHESGGNGKELPATATAVAAAWQKYSESGSRYRARITCAAFETAACGATTAMKVAGFVVAF